MTACQTTSTPYEVGYRKPPRHTQFKTGQSGNPGGRPRGRPAERLKRLAMQEAYRTVIVKEDGRAEPLPAIQAVLRSQFQLAASGNVRAQRAILEMIKQVEWEHAVDDIFADRRARASGDDAAHDDDTADRVDDDIDADDGDAEPAPHEDEIDTDVEGQQKEREQAAAPPSSADSALQPENAAAPPAVPVRARITKAARARDATPKRRARRQRGRSGRTAATRKAPPDTAASPGLQRAGRPRSGPPLHEEEKLKIPC